MFNGALGASAVSSIYGGTQSGHYLKTYYDGLGRKVRSVQRSFFSGPSTSGYHQEAYTDNWQDQVGTSVNANGSVYRLAYDFLGRATSITNPDSSVRTTSYDDVNRLVTMTDEFGRVTQNVYDVAGRLTSVRQYYSSTGYNATTYTYDLAGELLSVADPLGQTTRHTYDDAGRLVQTTYPDGTSEGYVYDNLGNLIAKTDRGGRTVRYAYEVLNRLASATYPGGSQVTYTYDNDGNVKTVSNGTASLYFGYDNLNRMTSRSLLVSGDSANYTVSYAYDSAGNLLNLTYPDGQGTLMYAYDPFYRVTSMTFGGSTVASFTYRKDDLLSTVSYGDNTLATYVFNDRGFPLQDKVASGSSTLIDLRYTENAAGDVKGITDKAAASDTETYGYDLQDRLTSAIGPWGTITYGYDKAGNRLSLALGSTTYYKYGTYNKLCASDPSSTSTCSSGAAKYFYDANGNIVSRVTSSSNASSTFDLENRLVKACTASPCTSGNRYTFAYDGLGDRVQETGPSGSQTYTNTYVASGDQMLYLKNVVGSTTTKTVYLYAGSLLIATVSGTTKSYFHQDHLGNTRLVTQAGVVVYSTNYEPFGVPYAASGTDPNVKYTGQWSEALGLYWNHARYYDPTLGRFVSADPLLGHLSAPQTQNRYAYAIGNPERFTDPSGRDCSLLNPFSWGNCAPAAGNAIVEAGQTLVNAATATVQGAVNTISSAGNAVSTWWNGLDPNVRTGIIFAALTIAVILTAGALAPAAIGAVAAMESVATVAAVVGVVSTVAYVGTSLATHRQVTGGGLFAAFTKGAFLGALGAFAPEVAGPLADTLGFGEVGAAMIEGGVNIGGAVGSDVIQGDTNPVDWARDAVTAEVSSGLSDAVATPGSVSNGAIGEGISDAIGAVESLGAGVPRILPIAPPWRW
jgi:RHS repeat-associated protein